MTTKLAWPTTADDWPDDYAERFWRAYPRKVAKADSLRKLDQVRKRGEVSFSRLLAAVRNIDTNDEKFIPYPDTWLDDGRYLDGEALEPREFEPKAGLPTLEELERRYGSLSDASPHATPGAARVVAAPPRRVVARVPPEPLIGTSEGTSILIETSACAEAPRAGKRVAEEDKAESQSKGLTASSKPPMKEEASIKGRCFALARELSGNRGAALCAAALEHECRDPRDVWEDLRYCQTSGEDIAYHLLPKTGWQPPKDPRHNPPLT